MDTLAQIQLLAIHRLRMLPQIRDGIRDRSVVRMMQSITEQGQLFPIRVRPDGEDFVIIDGHIRFLAIRRLGTPTTIAAIVDPRPLSDEQIVAQQLTSNCIRTDLTPCERAAALMHLMDTTGKTAAALAEEFDSSGPGLSKLKGILRLPGWIRDRMEMGTISFSVGYELSRVKDPALQARLAEGVAVGQLTREDVLAEIKGRRARPARMPQVILSLGSGRMVTLSGPGVGEIATLLPLIDEIALHVRRIKDSGQELGAIIPPS